MASSYEQRKDILSDSDKARMEDVFEVPCECPHLTGKFTKAMFNRTSYSTDSYQPWSTRKKIEGSNSN